MVDIADITAPETVQRIYKHYEDTCEDWRRPHLGASVIGHPCSRYKWFTFRWAAAPDFDGRMLRLLETGHREEARVIQNLRDIGIEVVDRIPGTDDQIRYASFCGHYAGSLDGAGHGFSEAPVTWHVLEMKTMSRKGFDRLKVSSVRYEKPQHYAQMQQYMAWSGMTRAYYFVVCKDTDEIYAERVQEDTETQERILLEAEIIIFQTRKPPAMENHSFFCKFCQFYGICWDMQPMTKNCRTCKASRPVDAPGDEGGRWDCSHCGQLSIQQQKQACINFNQIDM